MITWRDDVAYLPRNTGDGEEVAPAFPPAVSPIESGVPVELERPVLQPVPKGARVGGGLTTDTPVINRPAIAEPRPRDDGNIRRVGAESSLLQEPAAPAIDTGSSARVSRIVWAVALLVVSYVLVRALRAR